MSQKNLFWFRRDLRLHDNWGLKEALKAGKPVHCLFIYDSSILEDLSNDDLRVGFIDQEIKRLSDELKNLGSGLSVWYGTPVEVFRKVVSVHKVETLFLNLDYEPYALERDRSVERFLLSVGISMKAFDDQVIMSPASVVKTDGLPYTIFTPYSKRWIEKFEQENLADHNAEKLWHCFDKEGPWNYISIIDYGFKIQTRLFPDRVPDWTRLKEYHQNRDYPARDGTSRLGIHLRFGTISVRDLVREAAHQNRVFLNELIWREFYQMILFHFPHVVTRSFRPQYDRIKWLNDNDHFQAWCLGMTGYPLVDAGMRELNQSGYMHNRIRMVTASFLTKHLLIDWRWGEAYFASKLLDYDLAANNGGWQWAAGTGCDAAPYFRVFNPDLQQKRFDPQKAYIARWAPEYLSGNSYPLPIVDHAFARNRALRVYKEALQN